MGRRGKRREGGLNGILCIDKPSGSSSAWLARSIGRRLGTLRVGHAGTLDPFATGVLVVLLGEATKLSRWITAHEKEYIATIQFGTETDTLDREGDVTKTTSISAGWLTPERLNEQWPHFLGEKAQVAPVYSAIRVDGKRLMHEARAGREVSPPERNVTCMSLELRELNVEKHQATVHMRCSKGYYVRSFARDLGRRLEVGAHLAELRRVRSGPFDLELGVSPEEASREHLVPLGVALQDVPVISLNESEEKDISHGRPIRAGGTEPTALLVNAQGTPLAMAVRSAEEEWRVERGLNWSETASE
jgi:tRNA pseudouridine55 synthase